MNSHTIRIREKRWKEVEDRALQLSYETKRMIKPTDLADAAIGKAIKSLSMADLARAKLDK